MIFYAITLYQRSKPGYLYVQEQKLI